MNDVKELIEQTENIQSQVERLQKTIQELQTGLISHRDNLDPEKKDSNHFGNGSEPGEPPGQSRGSKTLKIKPISKKGRERRSAPRRPGNPVPILISFADESAKTIQGWVIDRSPEGLSIVVFGSIPKGTVLNVRPVDNYPSLILFPVEVRNCRAERKVWILGCQFVRKLSWSDLRLFG
ncbi:MAG TPA: PilZ domain-containing protein [Gemmataceae bacterium]|nr:PilZ domain-containing protein [Gemmataceae bacterium]